MTPTGSPQEHARPARNELAVLGFVIAFVASAVLIFLSVVNQQGCTHPC